MKPGAIPVSGVLNVPLPMPLLGPLFDAVPIHLQAVVNEEAGLRLGSGQVIVLLDESY